MAWRLGVDSGGTFTDICLFDEDGGRVEVWKTTSTPDDPSRGIAQGLVEAIDRLALAAADVDYVGHGTTVATNALIQGQGAPTGLVTTDGFRDLLEIGRQRRPELYDLQADKPRVLVSRDLRLEIPERVGHDGTVETPIDQEAMRAAARRLRDAGVKGVAVCFLYGFLASEHEEIACRILAEEFPEAFISAAHRVAPEFREFERLSTAVVNAYLGPVMEGYLVRLAERARAIGFAAPLHFTQSNGGIMGLEQARRLPVRMVLSGPSTGVVGAQAIGRQLGVDDLITFDMGGTSTDVALITSGECRRTHEAVVHGYPIKAPMLDIHSVGAGGGSIAYVDSGGLMKVGPRSAGADPGPACYGRGNAEPTVTDANLVLGTLAADSLLGGRMRLRKDLAEAAVGRLAERLGMDLVSTASGILSVVTANMAKAIRVISVQRGYDPRDYPLLAFGGAGPLHAAQLAAELDIKRIIVPRNPGILCAMGLLLTDLRTDFAASRLTPLRPGAEAIIAEELGKLEGRARDWFAAEGIAPEAQHLRRVIDMRYAGQNYELQVALSDSGPELPELGIAAASLAALGARFKRAHARLYGFAPDDEPIQLVTFRIEAAGIVRKAALPSMSEAGPDASGAFLGRREVCFTESGGFHSCALYAREALKSGNVIKGPAIIAQMDATTLVAPAMTARVDRHLNLILEGA